MRWFRLVLVLVAWAVAAGSWAQQEPAPAPKEQKTQEQSPSDEPAPEPQASVYPYNRQWHAGYADVVWGRPVPVVVPPVATWQTIWGQGIGATQIVPIYAQYQGPSGGQSRTQFQAFRPMPYWPTDTRQLGAYYIRGPWQPVPGVPGIPQLSPGSEYLSPPPILEVGIPRSFSPLGRLWRRLWHIDF